MRGSSRFRFAANQQSIEVVKDVPARDLIVAIVALETHQRGEREVLLPIRAILVIGVEGKALSGICVKVEIRNLGCRENGKRLSFVASHTHDEILCI